MIWKSWIMKTERLMQINSFPKVTVKKFILYIKLVNMPMSRNKNAQNNAYGIRLNNQIESLSIVNTMLLTTFVGYTTIFVVRKRSIWMKFITKQPYRYDHINPMRARYKCLSLISDQSIILIMHNLMPIRDLKSMYM